MEKYILSLRNPKLLVAFLIFSLLLIYLATAIYEWHWVFDDSYISYRYARNLAVGHGLVWNVGEAPTEGYTNLLLILVLAPFMSLGLDPLLVTRLLSLISLLVIFALLVRSISKNNNVAISVSIIIASIFLFHPASRHLWLVGLETVIYACSLLLSFILAVEYMRNKKKKTLILFTVMVFASGLLRPEVLLLYASFLLVVFINKKDYNAAHVVTSVILYLSLNALYVGWRYAYFGDVLPNPFYVKAAGNALVNSLGLKSVIGFIKTNGVFLLLLITYLFALLYKKVKEGGLNVFRSDIMLGLFFCLSYILFFLRTSTLMDIHGRFLYPLVPVLVYMVAPALLWVKSRFFENNSLREIFLYASFLMFLFVYGHVSYSKTKDAIKIVSGIKEPQKNKLNLTH